jgi:hypothetical protein
VNCPALTGAFLGIPVLAQPRAKCNPPLRVPQAESKPDARTHVANKLRDFHRKGIVQRSVPCDWAEFVAKRRDVTSTSSAGADSVHCRKRGPSCRRVRETSVSPAIRTLPNPRSKDVCSVACSTRRSSPDIPPEPMLACWCVLRSRSHRVPVGARCGREN